MIHRLAKLFLSGLGLTIGYIKGCSLLRSECTCHHEEVAFRAPSSFLSLSPPILFLTFLLLLIFLHVLLLLFSSSSFLCSSSSSALYSSSNALHPLSFSLPTQSPTSFTYVPSPSSTASVPRSSSFFTVAPHVVSLYSSPPFPLRPSLPLSRHFLLPAANRKSTCAILVFPTAKHILSQGSYPPWPSSHALTSL